MTEQQHRPSEVMQEEIMITPKALLEDNHSTNSEQLRKTWEENRRRGNLTVYFTCGDARIWTASPEESTSIRSIAAGGSKYPYSDLVNNRGVGQIVVLDHHDGDTAEPGQIPSGCGGLAAKEQFNGHQDKAEKGIAEYIKHEVKHPDVIVQALLTAEEIAMQTQKPVMAATQDHLTEEVFPIAVFSEGGLQKLTAIHLNDILGNLYNPSRLYSNGIPFLPDDLLPPNFRELLEKNREQVALLAKLYPDLKQRQKVQNPQMVVLSTDIRSMRLLYPTISQLPGSLFKLNIPRKKEGVHTKINPKDLIRTLNQAQYPIEHSLENFGDPTKPFSKTNTVFIQTGDIKLSRHLAEEAVKNHWMEKWLKLPNRQIIIAETKAGTSNKIEKFNPTNL